jgi:hypothetical protein
MIKTLNKLERKENFPNVIKTIHKKPTASITLNIERLDAFVSPPVVRIKCRISALTSSIQPCS